MKLVLSIVAVMFIVNVSAQTKKVLPSTTYQPAVIKMIGARLLVINPDNQEEYYDCRYEDCTIKRMNG